MARGGLLLALAAAAGFFLRRKGAAFLSWYWRMVIVAVLMVPLVPKLWTFERAPIEPPVKLVINRTPAVAPVEIEESLAASAMVKSDELASPTIGRKTGDPTGDSAAVVAARPERESAPTGIESASAGWFVPAVLTLWILGALAVFSRWLIGVSRFRGLWRSAVPVADGGMAEQCRRIVVELGLRRGPRLMAHSGIVLPMAGGLLRARILLPDDCVRWTEVESEMVLRHELVHVKRHDALFHLFSSVAKAMHWANPLAWWASRSMRSAAERAADDQVLASGTSGPDYAKLLVEFASRQMGTPSRMTPSVASSMAQPDTVESRVRRILDPRQRRCQPHRVVVAMLWIAFGGLLTVVGGLAFADDPVPEIENGRGGERKMVGRLNEMVIPAVDFTNATLGEAIEYCSRRSRELDPEGIGLNIIVAPGPDPVAPQETLSLRLRNVPLGELLRYMAALAGMELSVEPHSVVFRPPGREALETRSYEIDPDAIEAILDGMRPEQGGVDDPFGGGGEPATAKEWLVSAGVPFPEGCSAHYEPLAGRLVTRQTAWNLRHIEAIVDSVAGVVPPAIAAADPISERMREMVVPQIDFTEATLLEAIDFLREQSAEISGGDPLNLLVLSSHAPGVLITLRLQKIPFETALKYVAEFTGYEIRVDPHAVVLTRVSAGAGNLEMRAFPIKHPELRKRLAASARAAKEWTSNLGVTHPDGASSYFEPIGNNLIVRNEAHAIALIESILKEIEEAPAPVKELTEEMRNAATDTVVGFIRAETVEQRLEFVREPKRLKPLMEAWYAANVPPVDVKGAGKLDISVPHSKLLEDKGRNFVILALGVGDSGVHIYAVEQTSGGMKLDWETAIGYQPMPLEEFKKKQPKEGVAFRVKVKPSDYYNHAFGDENKYRAVELSYPGRSEFKLWGYIDRSARWAETLLANLEAGSAPSLIVKLKYPEGEIKDVAQVEITAIVSETWWP